jgi:hypothetical protein
MIGALLSNESGQTKQAVSETLQVGDMSVEQAPSEELQIAGR